LTPSFLPLAARILGLLGAIGLELGEEGHLDLLGFFDGQEALAVQEGVADTLHEDVEVDVGGIEPLETNADFHAQGSAVWPWQAKSASEATAIAMSFFILILSQGGWCGPKVAKGERIGSAENSSLKRMTRV